MWDVKDIWDTGLDEMMPQILRNMAKEEVVVTYKTAKEIDAVNMVEEVMVGMPDTILEKWRNGQIAIIYPAIPTGHIGFIRIQ